MTSDDLTLFNEYFQLQHAVQAHIDLTSPIPKLPDDIQFEQLIPEPFKIAADVNSLDQSLLRPIRQLGDNMDPLLEYLKGQSRKIDLILNYIMQQHDDDSIKLTTLSYGGSGFVIESEHEIESHSHFPSKLYFSDDATAIFCLTRVIEHQVTDEGKNQYKMLFSKIREQDREVVVRATLHQQSKQLSKIRNN